MIERDNAILNDVRHFELNNDLIEHKWSSYGFALKKILGTLLQTYHWKCDGSGRHDNGEGTAGCEKWGSDTTTGEENKDDRGCCVDVAVVSTQLDSSNVHINRNLFSLTINLQRQ